MWIPADGAWVWKDADVLDERISEVVTQPSRLSRHGSRAGASPASSTRARRWWDPRWPLWEPDPAWDAAVSEGVRHKDGV
jgi:hypothetical protein